MSEVAVALPLVDTPSPPVATSPYKFLDFYERNDALDFAGRDQEIDEIAAGVARGRTFVLYGHSGLGKTSLLHAGLIPRLEERGFEVKYLRVLASPTKDLCAAVAAHVGRPAVDEQELPDLLAARPEPFVLILDQFEEFFIRFRNQRKERERFAALLGRILEQAAGWVHLVVSLREDYYAELDDLKASIPDLTTQGHRLVSLSAYGVRQAVVRPLIRSGIAYEDRLVDQLVDEMAAYDFDPLLLQIICAEVYRVAVEDARQRGTFAVELRATHFEKGGGVRGALARYVDIVVKGLAGDDKLLACAVLEALTTAENTKRALQFADLLPRSGTPSDGKPQAGAGSSFYMRVTPEELKTVLDSLCCARLVRSVHSESEAGSASDATTGRGDWYELLHDRLVPVVKEWLGADPEFDRFRFAKKLIASLSGGRLWREQPGGLLSAEQLVQQVEPYSARLLLSSDEAEYVLRSAIQEPGGSVATWAWAFDEVAGSGKSVGLLLGLLAHSDQTVRRGAARAVAEIADPKRELPGPCANCALEDANEEVRRAAGRSLAKVAGASEAKTVREALSTKGTRRRALDVLTDLLEFDSSIHGTGFSRWSRWCAHRSLKKRLYHEHRDRIRERSSMGALHGLLAAVAFTALAGIPTMAAWWAYSDPGTVTGQWPWGWLLETAQSLAVGLLFILPIGTLLGWRGGARLVRHEALGGPPKRWIASGVRGFVAPLLLCVQSIWLFFRSDKLTLDRAGAAWIAVLGIVALVWGLAPETARWMQRTSEPRCSTGRALIWCVIAGAGPAGVVAVAVAVAVASFSGQLDKNAVRLACLFFGVVGLNLCVAGLVLQRGTERAPIHELPSVPPAARRRARCLAVGLVVGIPILALAVLGLRWVPFLARSVALGDRPEATLSGTSSRGKPVYFLVHHIKRDSVVSFDSSDFFPPSFWVEGSSDHRVWSQLARARDRLFGAVESSGAYHLRIRAQAIYDADNAPPASSEQWAFTWTRLQQNTPDNSVYHGRIVGRVAGHTLEPTEVVVQLVWPDLGYECNYLKERPTLCPANYPDVETPSDVGGRSNLAFAQIQPDGGWSVDFDIAAPWGRPPQTLSLLTGYRLR